MKATFAGIVIPHEKLIDVYSFTTGIIVCGEHPFYLKFCAKLTPSKQGSHIWAFDLFQN